MTLSSDSIDEQPDRAVSPPDAGATPRVERVCQGIGDLAADGEGDANEDAESDEKDSDQFWRSIAEPMDRFFDKDHGVFVMAEDLAVRENRLSMLATIATALRRVCRMETLEGG